VKDVLLDSGFCVNIISKSLRKKLGFPQPKPSPFVVRMVNQRKVQLLGLIKNLKIDLVGCEYNFFVIMLNMENGTKTYSMLLGRPWLK
jgi:hypothetical protein